MSTYYKECFVEQVYHYDALQSWQDLKSGDRLIIEYDSVHEKIKVKKDSLCLGELSEDDGQSILPFLKAGWTELFSAKLCLKSEIDSEGKRIKIIVYLEPNQKN